MSHSLKMLPCKKRRAVAVEPQSPSVDLSYHKEGVALLSDAESVKLESSNASHAEELRDSVSKHWLVSKITDTQPVSAADKPGAQPACSASTTVTLDEDLPFLEATDGGAFKGNVIPGKGTSEACSQRAWKEPVDNFLRSGKRITVKHRSDLSQDSGEGQQNTKETASATEFLEQGKDQEFTAEGKSPKLHTEVEVILQRHSHPADNHSPKQVAQVRSSLLLPIKAPATIKSLKNTKIGEQLQQTDEETEDVGLFIPLEEQDGDESERRKKRRKATKRKREERGQEEEASLACDIKLDDMLDRTLEDGAKQHNLTVVNVRNILHEVITNEHVVAMMKAAISETEDMPMFEPKMTRSKLKEVVEKGVVIPAWNISPIKKANEIKPPQFVDIPLEEDDSSDEEYQPEDEDEDETAEESLLESDVESTASSPRGAKRSRTRRSSDMIETDEEGATLSEVEKVSTPLIRHISAEVVPMGPPPPPKPKQSRDSTFMEKLHAVDEELASSPVCMDSYQSLDDSLIAFRTRSKRPLKDVPLGQLEAELRAPDITPDMYDPNTADDEDWKRWLGGLMNDDVESEDEADDDDDPEYNFLEDLDEPDTEDFRNDRAVRITKKEVNELMEELFETFQDEMGFSNMEDDGPEDEDTVAESRPNFNTPQVLRFEEPLANLLNEQHRTVKEQLEQLRIKKSSTKQPQEMERSKPQIEKPLQTLVLDMGQRRRLHQQMQQHVQLLTQIHLLTSSNPSLSSEASTTKMFLTELSNFAHSSMLLRQQFHPKFQTVFQPCNLKGALQLIEDFRAQVKDDWSPRKTVKKSANEFPCLPKQVAWILATRKVFMYPELLPICSLKAKAPQNKIIFTKAEDNLLALGLKHFEGTEFPKPLISKYLLPAKTAHQLTVRIKNLNMNRAPDNIIRYYKRTKQLPILFKCCEEIQPSECKPPVEREEQHLPFWLKASLSSIQRELKQLAEDAGEAAGSPSAESALLRTEKETLESQCDEKYPLLMPKGIVLTLKPLANRFSRRAWRRQGSAALKPLLIRPSPCLQQSANTINIQKAAVKLPQSEAPPSKVVVQIPRLIQPATIMQTVPGMQHLNIPSAAGSGDCFEFQSVLSTLQSDSRTSLPAAVPPALVSSTPVTFQTKMLPTLTASKIRKPCVRRGYQKKKGTKSTPLIKAAPLIHPAPVIFTVPAAAVKVVSIGNGCNMIHPINTTVGRGTQAIPIATLLVNPTTFPCPLNQPLVSSSVPPLIASPNSVGLPASSTAEDKEQLNPVTSCLAVNDENSYAIAEPKVEPQELYSSCSAISPKKEHSTGPATPDNDSQEKVKESECYSWIVVETVEKKALEPLPMDLLPHLEDLGETVKTEPEDPSDALEETNPTQEKKNLNAEIKEEFILDLGQELDMEVTSEHLSEQKEIKKECTSHQEKGQEKGRDVEAPTQDEQQLEDIDTAGVEMSNESSKNASHSTDVDAECSSPLGKPEDSCSVDGQSVGTPAGPEAVGEKDGQEEEEEEDFDDFTQDEEDEEEMSSASEESVLSVPELQETMEKLTWLATERRLSQEGDSEEENSQEENSEPEEEEEEEEEGEGDGMESLQKEDEMTDEIAEDAAEEPKSAFTFTKVAPEVETNRMPPDENAKVPGKNRNAHRARNKRGRTRASKDTSKLLLLYDEEILARDPLREQKDLAFAQAYLNRVREALRNVPGKYEDFLRVIYEFETSTHKPTAVDLYSTLQTLLQEWPQLLTDFAAFLLPEQALECGLFEEQQAFDKSRKFLRQLEICFAENPTHHQKIIKVLQSCADCLPQDIAELKTQMWQLLKGHDHLQDEFSIFFDHLRPSASRMGDFEEINWTEEKEYEFDGFEEVSLPDVEEEEETPKMQTASKNKKRKEIGGQNNDKEMEWVDGVKECLCSCHEGSSDPKLKKSKRRTCSHSSCKVCDSKPYKNKDSQELTNSLTQRELSPQPEGKELGTCKEPAEESLEYRDEVENGQSRTKTMSRKADSLASGSQLEGQLICCRGVSSEGALPNSRVLELSSTGSPLCSAKAGVTAVVDTAKESQTGITDSGFNIKLPQQNESNPYGLGSDSETRLNQRYGGTGEGSLDLAKHVLGSDSATRTGCTGADRFPGRSSQQKIALQFKSSVKPGHAPSKSGGREMERLSFPLEGKTEVRRNWLGAVRKLKLKTLEKHVHLQVPSDHVLSEADGTGCSGVSPFGRESQIRLKSDESNCCFKVQQQFEELECRAVPSDMGQREDEQQQKIMEATVCAKNSKVSSTGEKVVLWTREADRVILTTCQERGAHLETFSAISQELGNKTASEVSHRFRELMRLFHTSYDGSSEDEEDATSTSNTDQLSDKDLLLSEEEQDD
ncbi:GON-4-like protein isoform X2 [Lepidochelys kempii]|uniref:GON-4-like protein isoform X2 n=1 Tax=Lepidochelys kempii TaxID=8472 RepID=UPI003C7043C1